MKIPMIMVGALCALPCAAELVKVPYIDIIDGTAHVGVSVKTNGDLTAEPKSWGKVNVQSRDVEVRDGSVIIAVPANAEKGFMVLESGESK